MAKSRRIGRCGRVGDAALVAAALAPAAVAATTFDRVGPWEAGEPEPKRLAVADLDGDGHLDLVVTCAGSDSSAGKVSILWGDGSGDFPDNTSYSAGNHPWAVTIADLTGDGKPEVIVCDSGSGDTDVFVFKNTCSAGAPSFAILGPFHAGSFPIGVVANDVTGDGLVDVLVANNVSGGVSLLPGAGNGQLGSATALAGTSGMNCTDLEAGDFNNDGLLDLAVPNYSGVKVLKGLGGGAFSSAGGVLGGTITAAAAVGDLGGDGKLDLVGQPSYSSVLQYYQGNGNFGFSSLGSFPADSANKGCVAFDLDGNNRIDIAAVGTGSALLRVYASTQASPVVTTFATSTPQPSCVAAGDFNEDGRIDLVVGLRNLGDTGVVDLFLNTTQQQNCAAADLDCDGAVGGSDLAILLGAWGTANPLADLDHDGTVGSSDLAILLGAWG